MSTTCPLKVESYVLADEFKAYTSFDCGASFYNPTSGNKYISLGKDSTNGNSVALGFNYDAAWSLHDNSFTISFAGASTPMCQMYSVSNSVEFNTTVRAYNFDTFSDRRLKENIEELTEEQSSDLIDNIKVYSFNMINDKEEPKRLHYGVIAQELQEIAPELVSAGRDKEHYLGVNYTELIPHLINKIHQQDARIKELERKIDMIYHDRFND